MGYHGNIVGDHWRKRMATLVLEIKQFAMKNKVYIYITILNHDFKHFFFPALIGRRIPTESSSYIPEISQSIPQISGRSMAIHVFNCPWLPISLPRHPGLWDDLRPATFLRWGRWSGRSSGCACPKNGTTQWWIYHGYTIDIHRIP